MRKIMLVAAIAGLSLAACSEQTEDAVEATADSAAADTAANADAMGDAVDAAATDAAVAADATVDAVDGAAAEVEAEVQDETTAEAAVD